MGAGARWLPCAFFALVVVTAPVSSADPTLQIADCPKHEIAGDVVCYRLDVPENPATPMARTLSLRIMVLEATASKHDSDPLFVVAGGPGQAAAEGTFFPRFFAPVRETRDIVLLDQRGTGGSNPLPLEPSDAALFVQPQLNIPTAWGREALSRLKTKADLTQYTTARAVEDLDAVRRALDYQRINLYGTSYGTRVVQYYIKKHPKQTRSAVMKGVVPPGASIALSYGRNPQRALDRLFALCAADAGCASSHGKLRESLASVLAALARKPVTVDVPHPRTGKLFSFQITRGNFAFGVRSQMMNAASFVRLPGLISQAAKGDYAAWASYLVQVRQSYASDLYGGMTFSVAAAEDVPRLTERAIRDDARDALIGDAMSRGLAELASFWPRGTAPADLFEPLRSEIPLLLVSGELDPATPPEGAEVMMPGLPNSRHIVFAGGAHAASNFTGLDKIVADFIRDGSVANLDLSAVAASTPLPFQ